MDALIVYSISIWTVKSLPFVSKWYKNTILSSICAIARSGMICNRSRKLKTVSKRKMLRNPQICKWNSAYSLHKYVSMQDVQLDQNYQYLQQHPNRFAWLNDLMGRLLVKMHFLYLLNQFAKKDCWVKKFRKRRFQSQRLTDGTRLTRKRVERSFLNLSFKYNPCSFFVDFRFVWIIVKKSSLK